MKRGGITPITRPYFVVEPQRATEDAGVAAELPLPEFESQRCHRLGTGGGVRRRRCSPDERRHAHHVKCVYRAVIAAEPLGIAVACPSHVGPR